MKKPLHPFISAILFVLLVSLACNLPQTSALPTLAPPAPSTSPPPAPLPTSTTAAVATPTAVPLIAHQMRPADMPPTSGLLVYDVESSGTAPERRAPYGDSYKINRLERPFLQDMTYVPDLDIVTYTIGEDANWYYISIKLIGADPNNNLGIYYGVEIDEDVDGFGDILIWASPPYTPQWDVNGVRVLKDTNHNTAGRSATQSDAPFPGDGYETEIFNSGQGNDPDLAWVRTYAGLQSTLQIAFKKSLTKGAFMLGVLADAGWKDPGKLDYVDRITLAEAGSPVRDNKEYPLKALYAVDNACREAVGFKPTGDEPQLCPRAEPTPGVAACRNPSQYRDRASCEAANCRWVIDPTVLVAVVYICVAP